MPKRISKKELPSDVNQAAFLLVERSTQEDAAPPKRPTVSKAVSKIMSQMGRKGGKIGGKARLVKMTAEQRRQIASDAARARWKKA
jgi:hypothetical protein